MDFRQLISPATQKRLRDRDADMARFHGMDDAQLAREVLDLARSAMAIRADKVELPHLTYSTALLYQVIPFLAKTLDPSVVLTPVELDSLEAMKSDPVVNMHNRRGEDLRGYCGMIISNATMNYGLTKEQWCQPAIQLLDRHLEHGNPVALLVDRIAPDPHGLTEVSRPGNAPPLYPNWRPSPPRDPLPGFHLMVTGPDGEEDVLSYCATRAEADEVLDKIESEGIAAHGQWLRRGVLGQYEKGTMLKLDIRSQEDEVVSRIVELELGREPEYQMEL